MITFKSFISSLLSLAFHQTAVPSCLHIDGYMKPPFLPRPDKFILHECEKLPVVPFKSVRCDFSFLNVDYSLLCS